MSEKDAERLIEAKAFFVAAYQIGTSYPPFPLIAKQCLRIGGHCFRTEDIVIDTNPPIYHRFCIHCGFREEGHPQPGIQWGPDTGG